MHEGVTWQGFVLDCANQAWAFDAKHCKHFTLPWQQDRIIMIAFSVGHLSGLAQDAQDFLDSLGFQVPQGEVQHGPTMVPYAITDADIRCPQVATDSAPLHPVSPAFPHAELPGEGPLLIELCAGSAVLSQTAMTRGFATMPVDHAHNRHTPKCKLVNLDLTQSHSWQVLRFVLESRRVAMVFAAPPCGTCSAARHFRPGPPVLRTLAHPWGVPWASAKDFVKLKAANAIYKHLCAFIEDCESRSIPWCMENPTNSSFWSLPCLAFPLAHGFFAHCQACAFGSNRDKKTSFLCSTSSINRMALLCPGCKSHAAWGANDAGGFATAEEAAYPKAMCQALCDVFELEASRLGYPLGAATALLSRAHKQPRGRLHPQLISEHARVLSRLLPSLPPLTPKRCLQHHTHGVPAGSKLLRSENRGAEGVFCVFGVFRSCENFVAEARRLYHPFDSLAQQMPPSVRDILSSKRTALLEEMANEIQWPDKSLFSEMRQGFRLVGCLNPSGIFREGGYIASISEEDLMAQSGDIRARLLSRVANDPADENSEELYATTLEEAAAKGWLKVLSARKRLASASGRGYLCVDSQLCRRVD